MYFNLGLTIIPCGDVKKEMVEASNKTRLRLTYKVKSFSHWLQLNNVRCQQIIFVSGLLFSC